MLLKTYKTKNYKQIKHIVENWEEELENSSNERFAYFN